MVDKILVSVALTMNLATAVLVGLLLPYASNPDIEPDPFGIAVTSVLLLLVFVWNATRLVTTLLVKSPVMNCPVELKARPPPTYKFPPIPTPPVTCSAPVVVFVLGVVLAMVKLPAR